MANNTKAEDAALRETLAAANLARQAKAAEKQARKDERAAKKAERQRIKDEKAAKVRLRLEQTLAKAGMFDRCRELSRKPPDEFQDWGYFRTHAWLIAAKKCAAYGHSRRGSFDNLTRALANIESARIDPVQKLHEKALTDAGRV